MPWTRPTALCRNKGDYSDVILLVKIIALVKNATAGILQQLYFPLPVKQMQESALVSREGV